MKKQRIELRINSMLCLRDIDAEITQKDKRNKEGLIISHNLIVRIKHTEPLTINVDKGIEHKLEISSYKKIFNFFEVFENAIGFYKCKLKVIKNGYLEFFVLWDNNNGAYGMYSAKKLKI